MIRATLGALRDDVEAHIPPDRRGGSRSTRFLRTARVVIGSSGFRVALLYRLAFAARSSLGGPGRAIAWALGWLTRHAYGCSIAPTARIEGGLIFPHPVGIVIGPGAEVGPRAWIFQHVTIGGSPGRDGLPRVGPDARIYPGAVLAGPIAVGAGVVIGANAVVTTDVPDRTLVRPPASQHLPIPDRVARQDEPNSL